MNTDIRVIERVFGNIIEVSSFFDVIDVFGDISFFIDESSDVFIYSGWYLIRLRMFIGNI